MYFFDTFCCMFDPIHPTLTPLKNLITGSFFLLLCTCSLLGQDFYFDHYKVEDGLSHNTVFSSLQDQKGFLWFGTKNGLNRFDGYTFRLFQNDPDDPKSLKGNYVECLHEFDDSIWVGTDNGLFRYDDRFENFEIVANTANTQIFNIENDTLGNLWYIAEGTLYKYNVAKKDLESFPPEAFFNPTDIILSRTNEIWAVTNNALYQYIEAADSFKKYILDIPADDKNPFRVNRLFNLDEHTLLLGTQNHGVVAFDITLGQLKDIGPLKDETYYVRDFALREKDELWVATESGLHIYDLATGDYTNLKKNYEDLYALSDNAVYSLTVDDEGGVWAGTYFGGINYHPEQYSPFKKFFPMASENSLNGNAVREIHPDAFGNLWIGTEDGGLNKYDPNSGNITNYTSKDKSEEGILAYYNIHGLLPRGDKLWISMFDNGLDILNIKSNTIVKHYGIGDEGSLRSNFVFALYETKAKKVFAVTTSGIQVYDPVTDRFELFGAFPENYHYTCLFEQTDGTLWAGSYSEGLFAYNPKTDEKKSYKYGENRADGIAHNHINGIFQDTKDHIWVTTENGLNLLNADNKGFTKYSVADGFPSNVFYALLEDEDGILWISTANGLVAFDMAKGTKKIYTKADGLTSDQFNYNSAYKDANGRMYFGSVDGMISFDPKDFKKNTFSAPIYITGLEVNNQSVYVGQEGSPIEESIALLDHLDLSPTQSSFSLNFAALGYTAPENTEYWYKMDGLNTDWVFLQKDHKVQFTELAAGTYTFTAKSRNNSGVWGEETIPLQIEVHPVFWKSNLAYVLYALLLGLLLYLGFREYHGRVKAKNIQRIKQLNHRKEKEVYQAKIEFFTNISHEIRTPLTLIKSPLEKAMDQLRGNPEIIDNLATVEKNTDRLLDLVNQLLDFRKTETERISLTFVEINIAELLRKTLDRFNEAIKDKEIDLRLHLGEEDVYASVDAEAFRKIAANLFGNAIKYAKSEVDIGLTADAESFKLRFENDGKLIPLHLKEKVFEPFYRLTASENQTGTGIGLALARSLTELHHGRLRLDTDNGKTNCFILELPIHQEKEFRLRPSSIEQTQPNKDRPKEKPQPKVSIENGKSTILLVEDSEELLNFVAKELQVEYNVHKTSNSEQALEVLKEENIQLVISDIVMPGMDGFTLCKSLKTHLETSHIPVILLTSKSALKSKMKGLECGADAYIEKPFSIKHLKIHIVNLLENRRHILEHYASSPLAHIKSIVSTKTDETFINKLDKVIYENMADPDLNVETLAEIMHMSRSTLYRKIRDISNLSPNELINITRLKKSAELLKTGKYRIFEVAETVGYNSPTSFGRNFQKQFEMTPSDYMSEETE